MKTYAEINNLPDPGPKPPDYLMIHVRDEVVFIQQVTHYVNHGNTWQACPGDFRAQKELPTGKGISKFVCFELPNEPNAKHKKTLKHGSK